MQNFQSLMFLTFAGIETKAVVGNDLFVTMEIISKHDVCYNAWEWFGCSTLVAGK